MTKLFLKFIWRQNSGIHIKKSDHTFWPRNHINVSQILINSSLVKAHVPSMSTLGIGTVLFPI